MRKFPKMQRRWWWVTALVLMLALASCVTQIPSASPESPIIDAPADEPTAGADSTDEAGTEEAATDEAVDGEVADDEAPAAAVVDGSELIGGAALGGDETYKGLPVGFTEEGFPYRGDPDAPIVMIEYSDFGCPFCNRHFIQTEPAVDEAYVRSGDLRVVFHDFPLVSLHPNAPAAHEASLCVAGQGSASQYW
jgi:protein-disulfide isomerase